MDSENRVFRLALTPLTHMTISGKDIFPDIPETQLWTLLVVLALDLRGAYLLEIELCHFDRCPAHGQDLVHQTDRFQMGFDFVLHRGREPVRSLLSIEETALAIAGLAAAPSTAILSAGGKQCPDVRSGLHLCFKEHPLLSRGGNADMLCPCINPKRDLLFIPTTAIEQLQGEGDHADHFGLALLKQQSGFAWLAGHERLTVTIYYVNEQDVYHPFGRLVLFANVQRACRVCNTVPAQQNC